MVMTISIGHLWHFSFQMTFLSTHLLSHSQSSTSVVVCLLSRFDGDQRDERRFDGFACFPLFDVIAAHFSLCIRSTLTKTSTTRLHKISVPIDFFWLKTAEPARSDDTITCDWSGEGPV
jgi:hypothetical protein